MGREAILEINCNRYTSNIMETIKLFEKIGWEYRNCNNKIEFLPLGDNDNYNWQEKSLSDYEIKDLINKKQKNLEKIGLNLYYQNSCEGICLIANNTKQISLYLNIYRRTIENDRESITDIGWYIEHIIQALIREKCPIDYFKFEEYVG